MDVKQQKVNGFNVIVINEDRIDAHNSGELKEFILHTIEQGDIKLVVQLDKVKFIDSSGLGALLSGYKNAAAKSGKLMLAGCKKPVQSMFELTRLNRVFEMYANVDEACSGQS
jgi:anti-sigma B factor antagonist